MHKIYKANLITMLKAKRTKTTILQESVHVGLLFLALSLFHPQRVLSTNTLQTYYHSFHRFCFFMHFHCCRASTKTKKQKDRKKTLLCKDNQVSFCEMIDFDDYCDFYFDFDSLQLHHNYPY